MVKEGILHDYDLRANDEPSAQRSDTVCAICDAVNPTFQWSDYSGQAMCMKCGCPYQLKWGSDDQKDQGNYPYLGLLPECLPAIRDYWKETHRWTCFGMMLDHRPGLSEFTAWCKMHHPEFLEKE